MPAIYALYVINKSGGLIYNKEFVVMASNNLNDTLRLASIWHSLHAIAAQLSPAPGCTGIELLQADTFDLHCFQTLTGTKMLMVVEPNTPDVDLLLRDTIYDLYCDYVLKNPFYEVEMPIRLQKDEEIEDKRVCERQKEEALPRQDIVSDYIKTDPTGPKNGRS